MVQRKGEMTNRIAERDFPFGVEIEVPTGGLGQCLNELHHWCGARVGGGNFVTRGRLEGMRDFVVFRFKDQEAAAEFRRWVEGKVTPSLFSRRTFT
jgi:hypothetical protein